MPKKLLAIAGTLGALWLALGVNSLTLPVVFLHRFGPATPAMYDLVERHFFRRYASGAEQLNAYLPAEFADAGPESALHARLEERVRDAAAGGCPVLVWGVHDLGEEGAIRLGAELARRTSVQPQSVVIREFDHYDWHRNRWRPEPGAYVFLLGTTAAFTPCSRESGFHCNDIVVRNLCSYRDAVSACAVDGYSVHGRVVANDAQENLLVMRKSATGRSDQRFGKSESPNGNGLCLAEGSSCASAETLTK